jgi:hypothetical protein
MILFFRCSWYFWVVLVDSVIFGCLGGSGCFGCFGFSRGFGGLGVFG